MGQCVRLPLHPGSEDQVDEGHDDDEAQGQDVDDQIRNLQHI